MTHSRDSKEKKPSHPKLPPLRSVPAPQTLTKKAGTSLMEKAKQGFDGKHNPPLKPDVNNSTSDTSEDEDQRIPRLPPLHSTPLPKRPATMAKDSRTEKIRHDTTERGNHLSKLEVSSSKRLEDEEPNLPKLPKLPAVRAPSTLTEKGKSVLMKKAGRKLAEKSKALSKLEVKSPQGSERKESDIPKRPTLRSFSETWGHTGEPKGLVTKNDEQDTTGKSTKTSTFSRSKIDGSKNVTLQAPKLPMLRSVQAPQRNPREASSSGTKRAKKDIVEEIGDASNPGLTNPRKPQAESTKLNAPKSIPSRATSNERKRPSSTKRVRPKIGPSFDSLLPQPNDSIESTPKKRGQNRSKISNLRSVPLAKRLKGKGKALIARKVAKKLFGSGNTPTDDETSSEDSMHKKQKHLKRSSLRSVPIPPKLSKSTCALRNKGPSKKNRTESTHKALPKPSQRPLPTTTDSQQLEFEMNDNCGRVPDMKHGKISKWPHSSDENASPLSTGKVAKHRDLAPTRMASGTERKDRRKNTSASVKTIAKPKSQLEKPRAVRSTRKGGPRTSKVSKAQHHVTKRSTANEPTSTMAATSKSQRGYLSSSDSSDSDTSSESDGSYTSASSEEIERRELGVEVSGAEKRNVSAEDKESQRAESPYKKATAPLNVKKNDPGPRDHTSTSDVSTSLVPTKGIKYRASESILDRPSKRAGLKRASMVDIGMACDEGFDEEKEARPAKRQRNTTKKVARDAFQSLSYAEQLSAVGQDISGGGCPIRQDSPESEE